jgi:hypothetical protein
VLILVDWPQAGTYREAAIPSSGDPPYPFISCFRYSAPILSPNEPELLASVTLTMLILRGDGLTLNIRCLRRIVVSTLPGKRNNIPRALARAFFNQTAKRLIDKGDDVYLTIHAKETAMLHISSDLQSADHEFVVYHKFHLTGKMRQLDTVTAFYPEWLADVSYFTETKWVYRKSQPLSNPPLQPFLNPPISTT